MTSLSELLQDETKKAAIVQDCLALIEEEVAGKTGLSGMAIKAGYKTVKSFRPGFVNNVVRDLLPSFITAVEPTYQASLASGTSVEVYFSEHSSDVANALLSITDAKAEVSSNRVIKGAYKKLRGAAKKNVETAVPGLARLIEAHSLSIREERAASSSNPA
ncbi:MAG: hypothetical protein AAF355_12975 [Myxococcota bacterium]